MRTLLLVTHRWLGILAAVVLVVAGVTGAGLVYTRAEALVNLHVTLAMGAPGRWLVNVATIAATLLVMGGVALWWQRKILTIDRSKGLWRLMFDLHHALGIVGGIMMLAIALSGTGLMLTAQIGDRLGFAKDDPNYPSRAEVLTRKLIHTAHTGGSFSQPLNVLWCLGSASFAVQAVSGLWVWWKPRRRTAASDESQLPVAGAS